LWHRKCKLLSNEYFETNLKLNAMKTTILIFALFLYTYGINAMSDGKNVSYVKTGDKVYIGEELKVGLFNTKVYAADGTVTKIHNRDVNAYMDGSRLFEYLPVVNESNATTRYEMMEYLTTRSGLRLYRCGNYDSKETTYDYFVFKGGKYHLRLIQSNASSTLSFFGLKTK
jgi:hypothetical protein